MRRDFFVCFLGSWVVLFLAMISAGCASQQEPETPAVKVHNLGEAVESGPIRYTVTGTEWRERLGDGANAVTPSNRFLVVRLSVFNRSSAEQVIPPLAVLDGNDQTYSEASGIESEPQWIGLVRKVPGNDSRQAVAVFDVRPGRYRLRLMDHADQDRQALIDLPLSTSN
jgi:hypothetical protein